MRIAIGCDHRGIDFKKAVIGMVTGAGHTVKDFGTFTADAVDYPDIAGKVAGAVAGGEYDRGILICGTGIGMCISANKVDGIRAGLATTVFAAERSRQHNDANILCLGAEYGLEGVDKIVNAFLTTQFEGGRHKPRVDKIMGLEK